jgi:hypothetical protein
MKPFTFYIPILLILGGCHAKPAAPAEEEAAQQTVTPVRTDTISTGALTEYLELNGTSSFLKKNSVKASATGYLNQVDVTIGEQVRKDQKLFSIKTKEASALENTKGGGDSTFRFAGLILIRSFQDGIISTLNRHAGDFVVEGDELCVVSDRSSFIFLLDVPYELHKYVKEGSSCEIILPDKQVIPGTIRSNLPSMDVNSQTESFQVKPSTNISLPENLIARIRIVKSRKSMASTLPKSAVLSNETQTDFWVMKLINDSTAVKIPIKKGLETAERIEVTEPLFLRSDRILTSGNYGLADTAKIIITEANKKE